MLKDLDVDIEVCICLELPEDGISHIFLVLKFILVVIIDDTLGSLSLLVGEGCFSAQKNMALSSERTHYLKLLEVFMKGNATVIFVDPEKVKFGEKDYKKCQVVDNEGITDVVYIPASVGLKFGDKITVALPFIKTSKSLR